MMSSSCAASRLKASTRRTNSLGSAKTDCHSCSSLKEACDRQRPQCGTCQREQRKCGGYVLNLVWKCHSLGEAQSPIRCITDTNGPVSAGDLVVSERQFKFRKGRSKTKRKTFKCSGVGANSLASPRERSSSSSTSQSAGHITETSPWPELMDKGAPLQGTKGTEDYATLFGHGEQSSPGNYLLLI
jgi:hypothetical protein